MRVVQISESVFTVQGHGVHTAFVETVDALKQYQSSVEIAVNTREMAAVRHIHTVGAYALFHLLFGSGKKVVSAHIVPDSLVGSLRGARWWKGLASAYLRMFYNRADLVVAVSDETKRVLLSIGVKSRIEVVYNMIDSQKYKPKKDSKALARKELGYKQNDKIVVSNGQVQPRKRVDIFLQLAKLLPDVQFIWIGGIPFKNAAAQYQAMRQLITSAPKNVAFTGVVPLDQVRAYLHAADVFVMPSDQETFGLAIVEAAASGLPVVLRDLHDYDETFRDSSVICGEKEFSTVVKRLFEDESYRKKMIKKSAHIATQYDSKAISDQLVSLYRSLL